MSEVVVRIHAYIEAHGDERINLLKDEEVVRWVFGDTSFLPAVEGRTAQERLNRNIENENIWGRELMRRRRPDLTWNGQWTGPFGEYLCEEIYTLLGENCTRPENINGTEPDRQIDNNIIESKTQTYFTPGTAGEKILGVPFKYCDVPELYEKPLIVLCIGRAEKLCRENYGILPGPACTPKKQRFIDFYKQEGITFIGATDLLRQLIA
jgi:hypothetical protein